MMVSLWWFSQLLQGFKNIRRCRLVRENEERMFVGIRTLCVEYLEKPAKLEIHG